jgi:putative two-component system response regulator
MLLEILKSTYQIYEACDGLEALFLAHDQAESLSLILLDIIMPGLNGYEVLERLKADKATQHIPVIMISALDSEPDESRGLELGAIDYITKPFNEGIVRRRVRNQVDLKRYQDKLLEMVDQRSNKILHIRQSVFDAVASIIEYRSLESGRHVKRIRMYCDAQLNYLLEHRMYPDIIDRKNAELIARASSLQDIGKVRIPAQILTKPGRLTAEEFEIMKTHALIGSDFIDSLTDTEDEQYISYAREICRHHHERWDGKGYPDGLKGELIPLAARIASIADVYDALVSRRVYKEPFAHQKAVAMMLKGAGTQFDPCLIRVFSEINAEFEQIAILNSDENHI